MEQQRDLITFSKAVDHSEAVVHQGFDSFDHHIPEAGIKRRLKLADFLGKTGEAVAIQTGNQIQFREQDLIKRLLIHAHFCVKIIKVHCFLSNH